MTEEVLQGFHIPRRSVKRRLFRLFTLIFVRSKLQLLPTLFRPSVRTYGTFPIGEGKALRAAKLQTPIYRRIISPELSNPYFQSLTKPGDAFLRDLQKTSCAWERDLL